MNSAFNNLSPALKSKILSEFGSPILSIEYYDYRIDLFALNSLLIEKYQNIETGTIEKITQATFADLDKYTSQIMIGDLKQRLKSPF